MTLTQIRNSSLFLFVVCFFVFPLLQTIFIAISFLAVLFDRNFFNHLSNNKSSLGIGLVVYFLITAISLTYTTNLNEGLRSIETKFSFFVFPFFLPFIFSNTDSFKIKILNCLVFSGFFYVLLSFITAAYDYSTSHKVSEFFYGELGVGFFQDNSFVHPTYAAFFYNIIIAFLAMGWIEKSRQLISKPITLFLIGLFSIFILLLSSKFGILALLLNFVFLFFYFIRKRKKILIPLIYLVLFFLISGIIVLKTPLKVRFEKAYIELTNPTQKEGSTKTRKDVWNSTIDIIANNPILGVGTGDIKDELSVSYKQKGQETYLKRRYDPHQQFLQTFASLGLLGIIILLVVFWLLFKKAIDERNYLLLIFTFLFLLFGLVESMLERQAGVSFFVFFGLLLYSFNPSKQIS